MIDLIDKILAQKNFYITPLNYICRNKDQDRVAIAQIAFHKNRIYLSLNTALFYWKDGIADAVYDLHNQKATENLISTLNRMMDFYNQHPLSAGTGQTTGADFEYPIIL